nr:unnamed protein product [Callosobruchus chinensis]
MSVLSREVC